MSAERPMIAVEPATPVIGHRHTRRPPVSPEEWIILFDDDGRLNVPERHVRMLIFQGGLHPDIRIEAWKFLFEIYPWSSTFDEREAIRRSKTEEYFAIKAHWFNDMEKRMSQPFMLEKHQIDKDVHRTDRSVVFFAGEDRPNPDPDMVVGTNENLEIMKDILLSYNAYNTELGYVQGMSDLLAPIFVAMGDEAMAFWVFAKFMDRVQFNFFKDQSGMHRQLALLRALVQFMAPEMHQHFEEADATNYFFCFRWLLVWFKREFEWADVIRLWEVLWTDYLSDQMVLLVALAILKQHYRDGLSQLTQLDEFLRYINDLHGKILLEPVLESAETLFYEFERRIAIAQRKRPQLEDLLERAAIRENPRALADTQAAIASHTFDNGLLDLLNRHCDDNDTNWNP